jgi:hypothetical protein
MAKYTLHVSGSPIDGAAEVLTVTGGFHVQSTAGDLVVSVDAPDLEEAKTRLAAALPAGGSYTVARPPALEPDDD